MTSIIKPFCGVDPCPVILSSTCVFYTGLYLSSIGVKTNDDLQTVITKINQAFQNSGLGYDFNNGITQPDLSEPVQLGGSLVKDTTITGGYTLSLIGNLEATKHVTIGGTASQFTKGDGTLDSTSYQISGNYLTGLSGDGTAAGPGVGALILKTVNSSPGTFGNGVNVPVITVNEKGLITNIVSTPISIPPQSLLFIGDVVGSGVTLSAVNLSLQNVNLNIHNTNTFLKFAVNAKGLVTSASNVTFSDITNSLGYTPVPDTRTLTINGISYDLSSNRSWNISTLASVNLTTFGNNGLATWDEDSQTLNIPGYSLLGLGGVPVSRTITINGVTFDLSLNRSFLVGDIRSDVSYVNPSWIASIDWNKITSLPNTLLGYGITDAYSKSQADSKFEPIKGVDDNYVTDAQLVVIQNTSGTNTGDQDISGIAVNASDIDAIELEQITQNNAIALNTAKRSYPIEDETRLANTSGTNTGDETTLSIQTKRPLKTVNSESLEGIGNIVISGGGAVDSVNGQIGIVVLDADDIDDSLTVNKYVTASDLVTLANTSGVNTGDQDISGIATNASAISDINILLPQFTTEERESNTCLFDKNYIIGNTAARTGNILFDFTGAKLGATSFMYHDNSGAYSFPVQGVIYDFKPADLTSVLGNILFAFTITDIALGAEVVQIRVSLTESQLP